MLLDWINDELADHRILVKDLEEDLFDGQILQKLIGEYVCRYLHVLLTKLFQPKLTTFCDIFQHQSFYVKFSVS